MLLASSTPLLPLPPLAATADGELEPELLERCRDGERMALEQFVRIYERRVFAFLSRALGSGPRIDDLAQEVFIRAYQNIHKFDARGSARLSTWLMTIAYHVVIDARRRARTRATEPLDASFADGAQASPEQETWRHELDSVLSKAAEQLPTEQRDTFILAEYEGLCLVEISKITGANVATVKTRLFRARSRMRELLAPIWEVTR